MVGTDRRVTLFDLAARQGVACVAMPGLGREVRPWRDLRALVGLYRMMRSFRPHIVHTHTAKAGVYWEFVNNVQNNWGQWGDLAEGT